MRRCLIVDDDDAIQTLLSKGLAASRGEEAEKILTASSGKEARVLLHEEDVDVVLLDVHLPDVNGLQFLREIQEVDRHLPVIFITASEETDVAIEAMKAGAYDFISKPLDLAQVRAMLDAAFLARRRMNVEVALPITVRSAKPADLMIGRGPKMVEIYKSIGRCAAQDVPVLIRGESGTGKELVARAVYKHGARADKPFLAVNCAALSESLLESELFGHEKGAFTGADKKRIGKFEQCDGGTLFLDEVGDMTPPVQAKVLRLLQDQTFERVGGQETISVDVRLLSATNRPLEEMCEEGSYRWDLFYRLNGYPIELPPLRERGRDLLGLIDHFVNEACVDFEIEDFDGVSREALDLLLEYPWPGNVRELRSVIRQAMVNTTSPNLGPEHLPPVVKEGLEDASLREQGTGDQTLTGWIASQLAGAFPKDVYAGCIEFAERTLFPQVLEHTGGNQSQAADILGITRTKLRQRIKQFDIDLDRYS